MNRVVAIGGVALGLAYAAIWLIAPIDPAVLARLWFLPGIGVLGATIANTSGTGGGVVFVPVFNALRHAGSLDLDRTQVTAASFLIQCFGMSMGALRWSSGLHAMPVAARPVAARDFWLVVALVVGIGAPVMLATQRLARFDPHAVLLGFKAFSVLLGLAVIATTWTVNRTRGTLGQVAAVDYAVLAVLAVVGGFVTALFSVGLGELVALYLFIRHYPLVLCTGAAVVISAIVVLLGAPFHILAGNVRWEVIALAAPGAAVGGYIARPVALWLGATRMKTLDGAWIVASGLYLIALNI
jgi:uncharacterized membrane protein YfcA